MSESVERVDRLVNRYCNIRLLDATIKATQRRRQLYYQRYTTTDKATTAEFREAKRGALSTLQKSFGVAAGQLNASMPKIMKAASIDPKALMHWQVLCNTCSNIEQSINATRARLENCRTLMARVSG